MSDHPAPAAPHGKPWWEWFLVPAAAGAGIGCGLALGAWGLEQAGFSVASFSRSTTEYRVKEALSLITWGLIGIGLGWGVWKVIGQLHEIIKHKMTEAAENRKHKATIALLEAKAKARAKPAEH